MTTTAIRTDTQKLIDLDFEVAVFEGGAHESTDPQMAWSKGAWCRPTNFYCASYHCY